MTTMTRLTETDEIGVRCLPCGEYVIDDETIARACAGLWNGSRGEVWAQAAQCPHGNGWHLVALPN